MLLSYDDMFKECDGDIEKFIKTTPKMGNKVCFCSDAFEIGWLQEKVVFLM